MALFEWFNGNVIISTYLNAGFPLQCSCWWQEFHKELPRSNSVTTDELFLASFAWPCCPCKLMFFCPFFVSIVSRTIFSPAKQLWKHSCNESFYGAFRRCLYRLWPVEWDEILYHSRNTSVWSDTGSKTKTNKISLHLSYICDHITKSILSFACIH